MGLDAGPRTALASRAAAPWIHPSSTRRSPPAPVDVATGYHFDARIETLHLRALADDRHAIPPYDALVLASSAFLRGHPSLAEALGALDGTIDDAKMRAASALVDRDGQSPEAAAKWLEPDIAGGSR